MKVWALKLVSLALSLALSLTSCAALDKLLRFSSVKCKQNDISNCGSQPSKMVPLIAASWYLYPCVVSSRTGEVGWYKQ